MALATRFVQQQNPLPLDKSRRALDAGSCVRTTESDTSKFVLHTHASINAVVARLTEAKATMGSDAFKELETNLGFHYAPNAILFDPMLRRIMSPATNLIYDWMHVFFVNGVVNLHVGIMFKALRKSKCFTYATAYEYMQLWVWPKALQGCTGIAVLAEDQAAKHLNAGKLLCSASDGRSIMPLLAHYVRQGLLQSGVALHREHAECFLHLAGIIEELEACNRGTCVVDALKRHCEAYLDGFCRYVFLNNQPCARTEHACDVIRIQTSCL